MGPEVLCGIKAEYGHQQGCRGHGKALWSSLVEKETWASVRGQAAQGSSVHTQSLNVVWKLILSPIK